VETIDVQGLRIAYERAGTGPAVVLLHGYVGDGATTWRSQIDALSDDFTIVAWDAPGAGGSADPPESFGMAEYSDCLAGFVARLGLDRPVIVGLSFGGALESSGPRCCQRCSPTGRRKTFVNGSVPACWPFTLPGSAPWPGASAEDLRDALPHLRVPTLLIYGDQDIRAPLDVARRLHSAIPHSGLVLLPEVGHACNVEAAHDFNSALRNFLLEHRY
jgi:pimeloyl-ACP methyl ester carboxylesterase